MVDMKKALAKVSTQKFTAQDKKMVIDAIKVRYNGILSAIGEARNKQQGVDIPDFPIRIHDSAKYKAILSTTQRHRFVSAIKTLESLQKDHEKAVEARDRIHNANYDKSRELSSMISAERDELIFQVSLLGSSDAANEIINNLRDPEAIANELSKNGLDVVAETIKITGIGFPSPKQIGNGQEA